MRTDQVRGARPGQSDRRAHRLQPGFRAADRTARTHGGDAIVPDDSIEIAVRSDREDGDVRVPLDTVPGDVDGWAAICGRGGVGAARCGPSRPGRDDVDHQRRRDGLGGVVVGGTGVCGPRRADHRCRSQCRSDRAGAHRAAGRERLCRRAHRDDGPTGLAVRRAAQGADDRLSGAHRRPVRVRPEAAGVALLLINSRAPHRHAGWRVRVAPASCERAAADLGVSSLRERAGRGPRRARGRRRPGRRPPRQAHRHREPARARCRCGAR